MTLKETLHTDLTAALKGRDTLRLSVIRSVLAAIQEAEKAGKVAVELDDQGVERVLRKQLKQREETSQVFKETGHLKRAQEEAQEAIFIAAYLPQELTEEELRSLVEPLVADATQKDFGRVMKEAVAAVAGRADGKRISTLVRELLA